MLITYLFGMVEILVQLEILNVKIALLINFVMNIIKTYDNIYIGDLYEEI